MMKVTKSHIGIIIRISLLGACLIGVIWLMNELKSDRVVQDPNGPIQVLVGEPPKENK